MRAIDAYILYVTNRTFRHFQLFTRCTSVFTFENVTNSNDVHVTKVVKFFSKILARMPHYYYGCSSLFNYRSINWFTLKTCNCILTGTFVSKCNWKLDGVILLTYYRILTVVINFQNARVIIITRII